METSRGEKVLASIRRNVLWTVPPLAIATTLGIVSGLLPALLIYTVVNLAGVWLYCDQNGPRQMGRQRAVRLLAIPLLPSGILAAFATPGGLSPAEKAGTGSDDPDVRTGAAVASATSPASNMPSSF